MNLKVLKILSKQFILKKVVLVDFCWVFVLVGDVVVMLDKDFLEFLVVIEVVLIFKDENCELVEKLEDKFQFVVFIWKRLEIKFFSDFEVFVFFVQVLLVVVKVVYLLKFGDLKI